MPEYIAVRWRIPSVSRLLSWRLTSKAKMSRKARNPSLFNSPKSPWMASVSWWTSSQNHRKSPPWCGPSKIQKLEQALRTQSEWKPSRPHSTVVFWKFLKSHLTWVGSIKSPCLMLSENFKETSISTLNRKFATSLAKVYDSSFSPTVGRKTEKGSWYGVTKVLLLLTSRVKLDSGISALNPSIHRSEFVCFGFFCRIYFI